MRTHFNYNFVEKTIIGTKAAINRANRGLNPEYNELTAMLTKKEFTAEEKQAFEQMGIDIYEEVLAAINASSDKAAEFWNTLYGGDEIAAADPKYQRIIALLNKGNDAAIAQAQSVSERLKAAMMKGFEDGFTEDDYDTILGLFEEYNALIAEAQAEAFSDAQLIEQEKLLHKAQTASLDAGRAARGV